MFVSMGVAVFICIVQWGYLSAYYDVYIDLPNVSEIFQIPEALTVFPKPFTDLVRFISACY